MFRFAHSGGLDQPELGAGFMVPGLSSMVLSDVTAAQLCGWTWSYGKSVGGFALTANATETELKDSETLSAMLIEWGMHAVA